MKRAEITRKFDEIVAFAEVEKFLDTPVKRYSSGMYVRLAFAVAAHLEPESLIVDEVLAVGDAEFQKKCLGKMQEVSHGQGRTVLFVSHQMAAVQRLCTRGILLSSGGLVQDGTAEEVAQRYMDTGFGSLSIRNGLVPASVGDDTARMCSVQLTDEHGAPVQVADVRQPLLVQIEYENLRDGAAPTAAFHLVNEAGVILFASADFSSENWSSGAGRKGRVRSQCLIPGNFLAEGRFSVLAAVCSYNPDTVHALEANAVSFLIIDRSDGDGVRGPAVSRWPGVLRPLLHWTVDFDSANPQ
jgi:lipopolysaccharide transport system ATP-binding protein